MQRHAVVETSQTWPELWRGFSGSSTFFNSVLRNNVPIVFWPRKKMVAYLLWVSPIFWVQFCAILVSVWAVTTYLEKSRGWLSQKTKHSPVFSQHPGFSCVPFCSLEQNSDWFQSFPFQNNCFPDAALDSPSKELFFFLAAPVKEWQILQTGLWWAQHY